MIIFLLPFAVVIGAAILAGRRSQPTRVSGTPYPVFAHAARHALVGAPASPYTQLVTAAYPPPPSPSSQGAPGPMAVLIQSMKLGQLPNPFVVKCAIAEAQLAGRNDVASQIAETLGHLVPDLFAPQVVPQAPPAPQAPQAAAPMPPAPQAQLAPQPLPMQNAPSPIAGVPDDRWSAFAQRLVCESPEYQTSRHVGRYRHHRGRLLQIGIDPDMIIGAPDAQDTALSADVVDACRHVKASGMGDDVIGKPLSIPAGPDGASVDPQVVTLSGVLGVTQVAGLEGGAEWFANPKDRTKYPGTTKTFLACNGVF